jgi:hypothetical protein
MYQLTDRLRNTVGQWSLGSLALLALAAAPVARADNGGREPDLSVCPRLAVAEGNELAFHVYALGVQIYQWSGSAWVFVAPYANLYADAGFHGQVGTHYAGPTWESNSGSKVLGTRLAGCTADASAIPWLRLGAVSSEGPGIFDGTTFIQRVNTVGGTAPAVPGSTVGEIAQVAYMAEYYFYRALAAE